PGLSGTLRFWLPVSCAEGKRAAAVFCPDCPYRAARSNEVAVHASPAVTRANDTLHADLPCRFVWSYLVAHPRCGLSGDRSLLDLQGEKRGYLSTLSERLWIPEIHFIRAGVRAVRSGPWPMRAVIRPRRWQLPLPTPRRRRPTCRRWAPASSFPKRARR